MDTSKFLLSAETSDNKLVAGITQCNPLLLRYLSNFYSGIHLGDAPEIDAESRANLEALLDAGMTQTL